MILEYAPYILVPMFIGYMFERYKDMSTLKSGILVFLTLFFVKLYLMWLYGGSFFEDYSEIAIYISIVVICMISFHLQKWIRRAKKP